MKTATTLSFALAGLFALAGPTRAHEPEHDAGDIVTSDDNATRPVIHFSNRRDVRPQTPWTPTRVDEPQAGAFEWTPRATPFGIVPGAVLGDKATFDTTRADPALDNEETGDQGFGNQLPVACRADLDGSGEIDAMDIFRLLSNWGACQQGHADDGGGPSSGEGGEVERQIGCDADISRDGFIDFDDLLKLLAVFGERCS